jgi:hypothetical protein
MLLIKMIYLAFFVTILFGPAAATQYDPPWAHNYDFFYSVGNDTRPCASNAEDNLDTIGYDAYAITDSGALNSYNNLKDDAIYFFVGHGTLYGDPPTDFGGGITFWDGSQKSVIAGEYKGYTPTCPMYYIGNTTTELKDVLLAVYAGCYTGRTSDYIGNLVDESANKGVDYVIGFTRTVEVSPIKYWSDRFWTRCNTQRIKDANEGARIDVFLEYDGYYNVNYQNLKYRSFITEYLYPARYGVI